MDSDRDRDKPTQQAGGSYRLLIFGLMLALGIVAIVLLALNRGG